MENGVQALKIAASVLIFVIAITIAISAFTSAIQALNRIFNMRSEDEYVTVTDENGNEYYLNFVRFNGGTRKVGVETIIPSIYRAYKENYAIYFFDSDNNPIDLDENDDKEINYIDLEKEVYSSTEKAIEYINTLLYDYGLYERLKEDYGTFTEKLGEYYMNDVEGETEIAEVNKIKKRVIVYIAE